jgi:hypothetical protein
MPSFTRVANGNIKPYRFVTQVGAPVGQVLQCGAGGKCYGISGEGNRRVSGDIGLDDGFAAVAGENVNIYGPPHKDVLLVMNGTCSIGDRIKSDTDGGGLTTVTNLDEYGAIADEAATVVGQLIRVQVVPPTQISS